MIRFFVEDPESGEFVLAHVIEYPNANTTPSITNPSLRFGIYAASIGSTTNLTVQCASVGVFVQGAVKNTRNPRAVKQTQTVSTSFTNVLTIRNRRTYNYYNNQVEVEPISLSFSSESTKNVEIEVRGNATFSGSTNFLSAGTNLVTDIDTTANTVSGGTLLAAFTLSNNGNAVFNLKDLEIRLPPSITFTVAARVTSGANASVTAALTYYEDL